MHEFHPSILREYDIRGTVGETLGVEDAFALGRAFGTRVRRAGGNSVCTGYDGRLSSPELEEALCDGLTKSGLAVHRVGLGPTPMLYYAVHKLDTDGGIMVTGSHNPPDYNGFKMMLGKEACFGKDILALGDTAAKGDFERGDGRAATQEIMAGYIERLLADFDGEAMNISWDAGNGSAGEVMAQVAGALPGRHTLLFEDIDGTFPNHHPDPTVEKNLADLKKSVAANDDDMGFGFDGDGDRIGAIDGTGQVVWGDQILAILATDVLREVPGAAIIADVKASQTLFDHIAALGGQPVMWKTGHSLIKAKMAEMEAPLAGEMSGHIFFKHKYYGYDDALYAAIRLINAVSRQGGNLAEIRARLPEVINTPELRFACDDARKFAVVDEVRDRLQAVDAEVSTVDGVRVAAEGGWWLLRASNTQAVLVARCEAPDEEALGRLKTALIDQLALSGVEPPPDIFD